MNSHDFSLNSGERQTAGEYEKIRADHRFRYEWAQTKIPRGTFGLDLFCGNGYGSWLLGQSRHVIGIDASGEAIEMANQRFKGPSTFFSVSFYPFTLPTHCFDYVVSLESIEHVEHGEGFFKEMCQSIKLGGHFIFSTPCEDLLPHASTGNHFHYRHYTLKETLALAESFGLELVEYCGQNVYEIRPDGLQGAVLLDSEMVLTPDQPGQFIIVHAIKSTKRENHDGASVKRGKGLFRSIFGTSRQ